MFLFFKSGIVFFEIHLEAALLVILFKISSSLKVALKGKEIESDDCSFHQFNFRVPYING